MQEDGFVASSESLSKNVEAKEEDPIYEYARTQHLYAEGMYFLYSHTVLKRSTKFFTRNMSIQKIVIFPSNRNFGFDFTVTKFSHEKNVQF